MTTVILSFYCTPIYLLKITQLATKLPIYPSPFRHYSSLRHFHKRLVCNAIPRCSYKTRNSFGQLPSYPLKKLRLPSELPIYPPPFYHFSSLRHFHKHFVCNAIPCCSHETQNSFGQSGSYPKPSEIKWKEKLCNSVQLIGYVGFPVKLTYFQSGKVVSSTRLCITKSGTQTTWIKLRFWGKLAHTACQHLQTGNQIYVFGHLQSDTIRTEDGKQRSFYKAFRFLYKPCSMAPGSWCATLYRDSFGQSGSYPKPSEVKWKKALCNAVHFIGVVGFPVELTHFKSGRVKGSTRLGVKKFSSDKIWITLTFWNELALIAHQHLQKGNLIYVSGRLLSDTVGCEEGKMRTYYQVDVQQLNLVEKYSPSPVSLYDESYSSMTPAAKFSNSAAWPAPTKLSTQELWQAFFANPVEWWDNRNNKKNPKAPDFKHKDTREVLWVEDMYNPPWVKSQLEILDSRMQCYRKQDEPGLFSYLNGGF